MPAGVCVCVKGSRAGAIWTCGASRRLVRLSARLSCLPLTPPVPLHAWSKNGGGGVAYDSLVRRPASR